MKTKMNALVAMCLGICMVFTACGKTEQKESTVSTNQESVVATETKQEESKYPEYLNMDSFRPIIKEGEEITLKIATIRSTGVTTDINETWFVKFIEEKLNINLEIDELRSENMEERKSLMLASGEVPDILMVPLTNSDVVEYGVEAGELLPLSDYFSEELTPNILAMLENEPEAKNAATASDGKIYAIPKIKDRSPGLGDTVGLYRVFVDTVYMDAAGIKELPTTLDGFVDMLRAFKKIDPSVLGVDEFWPLVSRSKNDLLYFQNAFGWLTVNQNQATAPCLDAETGNIVVPCLTEEYAEFVKLYNTLYSEGLIHPDTFTMDNTAARALYAERKAAVNTDFGPHLFAPDDFNDFIPAKPLTSEWSADTPAVTSALVYQTNLAFVSADTEYPEVCLRLLDYLYSAEGSMYSCYGCPAESEDTMGMIGGYYLNDEGVIIYKDVESGVFDGRFNYTSNMIQINNDVGGMDGTAALKYQYELVGGKAPEADFDMTTGAGYQNYMLYTTMNDYLMYPLASSYMDAELSAEYTDLATVLESYHDKEFAKFVVGQRPIEEVDQLLKELMDLGGDEYLELVKKIYGE